MFNSSTRTVHKVKKDSPYQNIFNNNTDPQYTSIGTYLCLFSHKVAFDIKTLVEPWYQFVYTLFIPYSRLLFNQHLSGLHHFRSVYQQGAPSFLGTGKIPTVPGPNCTEDARRCHNGIAHAARLVSAGQYADVHCRATEQLASSAR